MNKKIRNIIIFGVIAIGGGFLGMLIDSMDPPADPMQGLGALIWLVSPLLANILLRALGGDGWKDFGLRPHFKESWLWYLVSIVITPLIVLIVVLLGLGLGFLDLSGDGLSSLLPLIGAAFIGSMAKNIFEEFAWRGYLTPRLKAVGVKPGVRWLVTGLIWAGWHVPYYLYFLNRSTLQSFTTLSLPAFIVLAFLILPIQAIAYGELRLLSKSVWPAWLMHTVVNAITLPLVSAGFVMLKQDGLAGAIFTPGTDGIFHTLLMGGFGLLLFSINKKRKLKG